MAGPSRRVDLNVILLEAVLLGGAAVMAFGLRIASDPEASTYGKK